MPKFMLILHDSPTAFGKFSPDELQRIMERYRAWSDKITAAGRRVVGEKLMDEGGKILTKQQGRLSVVDGPYSETKEVIGGYITIRAASYDEAIEVVSDCPHLEYGRLSMRQVDPMGCQAD